MFYSFVPLQQRVRDAMAGFAPTRPSDTEHCLPGLIRYGSDTSRAVAKHNDVLGNWDYWEHLSSSMASLGNGICSAIAVSQCSFATLAGMRRCLVTLALGRSYLSILEASDVHLALESQLRTDGVLASPLWHFRQLSHTSADCSIAARVLAAPGRTCWPSNSLMSEAGARKRGKEASLQSPGTGARIGRRLGPSRFEPQPFANTPVTSNLAIIAISVTVEMPPVWRNLESRAVVNMVGLSKMRF